MAPLRAPARRRPDPGSLEEVLEGLEVGQRLPPLRPPGVLAADGGGEAELEEGVEVAVGGLEDLAEDPVELVRAHRDERDAADEVDVADPIERFVYAVEAGVVLHHVAVDASG